MNYLTLSPGQAIYVPASGLHAYLSGDIIECMARSNNVLNTGFCPPVDRDDIDLFMAVLRFEPQRGEEALLLPRVSEKGREGRTRVYSPPVGEFDCLVTELGPGGERETLSGVEGPSVLAVTAGTGKMSVDGEKTLEVQAGFVFFVGRGVELRFETEEQGDEDEDKDRDEKLVLYRASTE